MRTGRPPPVDLAWAVDGARAVNDRRLALATAAAHGLALPGVRVIERVDDITPAGPWVAKAPWTAAGRDRCHGDGTPTIEQRTRIGRLLATFGSLVLEPWCDRIVDVGVCATVAPNGTVTSHPPHALLVDRRGNFLGIDLAPPELADVERTQLAASVSAAGAALAAHGYRGPFAVDAFAYRDRDGTRRFHPLCEINARYSFGWVARGFGDQFGTTKLGFADPPVEASVLIAPGAYRVCAWIA
jgi:hypothetical protein